MLICSLLSLPSPYSLSLNESFMLNESGDSFQIYRLGKTIGVPTQASLVAQAVKNLPARQETCFWSLGWEVPLEKGIVTHSSILSSADKEPTCIAGDCSWIPASESSPGEEKGYPLQYSWTSLEAQMVKSHLQWGRPGFDPWFGMIPWRRPWQPTPVFLTGESPWTEAPSRPQSMWLQRVRHDLATKHSQYSCLENSMDTGAWWTTVPGVAKSQARLSDQYVCFSPTQHSQLSVKFYIFSDQVCTDFV